jgi:hypothetical protein
MANQQNYPELLQNSSNERPVRITHADSEFVKIGDKQITFGTTDRDLVEMWVYNPDGSFAGHINLNTSDSALGVATIVDVAGPTEIVTIDLEQVALRMGLETGRYSFIANFFRDEIGAEDGYKLYIVNISTDRTELRLYPVSPTVESAKDIFEFVVPSVPRQFAKGLLDEVFGQAVVAPASSSIDGHNIAQNIELSNSGSLQRITLAGATDKYNAMISNMLHDTYVNTIKALEIDVKNLNVQQTELNAYVSNSLYLAIYNMQQKGQIDPRFKLEWD